LTVQCHLLNLDADFFDIYEFQLPERLASDQYVLTEIETFFLFQSKNQIKPRLFLMPPEITNKIHDDVATDGEKYAVNVKWKDNNDPTENEIVISASSSSEFRLTSPKNIEIPNGGSVVLRNAGSATGEKSQFLWILARTSDNTNAGEHGTTGR
jgi:hypothetical protein